MKSFRQFLVEMPIGKFQLHGKWPEKDMSREEIQQLQQLSQRKRPQRHGWKADDIKILTSPNLVEKIKKKWQKVPQTFDLHFVRIPGGTNFREKGEVNSDFIRDQLKLDIPIDNDNITIIFTQNVGDERKAMNYWTMAHRGLGHALQRDTEYQYFAEQVQRDLKEISERFFNLSGERYNPYGYGGYGDSSQRIVRERKNMLDVAHAIGTMGSARARNVRNFGEFPHEIISQYIITGRIKFNVPKNLITRYNWGNPQYQYRDRSSDEEDLTEKLRSMEEYYTSLCQDILQNLLGRVFVV